MARGASAKAVNPAMITPARGDSRRHRGIRVSAAAAATPGSAARNSHAARGVCAPFMPNPIQPATPHQARSPSRKGVHSHTNAVRSGWSMGMPTPPKARAKPVAAMPSKASRVAASAIRPGQAASRSSDATKAAPQGNSRPKAAANTGQKGRGVDMV